LLFNCIIETLNSSLIKSSRVKENIKCSTTENRKIYVYIGISYACVRPWVNRVFAFLYFLFYFPSKAIGRTDPLQISFEKNIIKLLDNIIVLLPKTTCGVVEIYGGTLDEGRELDGQQRNYIRSSRRLYIIITYRSFTRITDALTSIGEIFYLLLLICPTKRYNISRRSLLSVCTYNV